MLTQGPAPDPKCKLIISSYISTFIALCEECHVHCIVVTNEEGSNGLGEGGGRWGKWLIFVRVWVCISVENG